MLDAHRVSVSVSTLSLPLSLSLSPSLSLSLSLPLSPDSCFLPATLEDAQALRFRRCSLVSCPTGSC